MEGATAAHRPLEMETASRRQSAATRVGSDWERGDFRVYRLGPPMGDSRRQSAATGVGSDWERGLPRGCSSEKCAG
jgi:hypothetical protein